MDKGRISTTLCIFFLLEIIYVQVGVFGVKDVCILWPCNFYIRYNMQVFPHASTLD